MADFVIDNATSNSVEQLDKIQRRVVRIIDRGKYPDCSNVALEQMYNLEPLRKRRKRHHLVLMYKLAHAGYNLEHERPNIVLRNRNKLKFQTAHTTLTKVMNSPYFRGAKLWDTLPENI